MLVDHMNWLYDRSRHVLQQEWQSIVHRAALSARIIWRSAAPSVEFVDPLTVSLGKTPLQVGQMLSHDRELASRLHVQDRVHTYGSFYITELDKSDAVTAMAGAKGNDAEDAHPGNVKDTCAAELAAYRRCHS